MSGVLFEGGAGNGERQLKKRSWMGRSHEKSEVAEMEGGTGSQQETK